MVRRKKDATEKTEDKLYVIGFRESEKKAVTKEFVLGQRELAANYETVDVGLGFTIASREFESIKINYRCVIHHNPGQEYRENALDLAEANCLKRIKTDIKDLYLNGVIQDHFLLSEEDKLKDDNHGEEVKESAKRRKGKSKPESDTGTESGITDSGNPGTGSEESEPEDTPPSAG